MVKPVYISELITLEMGQDGTFFISAGGLTVELSPVVANQIAGAICRATNENSEVLERIAQHHAEQNRKKLLKGIHDHGFKPAETAKINEKILQKADSDRAAYKAASKLKSRIEARRRTG